MTYLALLLVIIILVLVFGHQRWQSGTNVLRGNLLALRSPVQPPTVDFAELEGLPAPAQRFFRAALTEGQPMIAGVRLQHAGTFNMGEARDQWRPFTSSQQVVMQRPGFDWDGRIKVMPGLAVRVHDAYVGGEGILHASLFGLLTLANLRGTRELAEGELMRFLAEAAWYPTALLPSQGVFWQERDDRSAYATLTDGEISVTLLFSFDSDDLIETVYTEARGRTVAGKNIPTPWRGRFWNYETRAGMKVPQEGEVAWQLPEGEKAYWRGRLIEINFE